MKQIQWICVLLALVIVIPIAAENLTGRGIMVRVDEREDGDDRTSELEMTLINKRGSTRERKMKSFGKDYGDDTKQVMVFLSPADVSGVGYLSWEYEDEAKDDDRWLYMPALRKVRRISGSSSNDYFMGSDFTYDDMGDRNVDEDTHTLLREEELDGHLCWVVESIPKDSSDMYRKKVFWIRKDIDMTIRCEYYDEIGLMKTLTVSNIREIDGIWTAHEMFMDNFREKHQTRLTFEKVSHNQGLKDNLFTVTTIERGRIK